VVALAGLVVVTHEAFSAAPVIHLVESQRKRSVGAVAWHVRLRGPYLGTLEANRVHDRTLGSFAKHAILGLEVIDRRRLLPPQPTGNQHE
jgi:hypothetical protein